jgi:predicted nucleotidyltransferase
VVIDPKHQRYWQRRFAQQSRDRHQAKAVAWQVVEQIATYLRQEFGSTQVLVFGSLLTDRFNDESDLDIVADRIPRERFFEVLAIVNRYTDRWVDLKPLEDLEPYFRQRVIETGVLVHAGD